MCDQGRYGYKFIDHERLVRVQPREQGTLRTGTWDEALERISVELKRLAQAKQLDQAGVILSSHLTNEDLYAAKRAFSELGVQRIVFQRPPQGKADELLMQADKSPNTKGAQALGLSEGVQQLVDDAAKGKLRMLFVFTQDLTAVIPPALVQEAAKRLECLVFIGTNVNATSQMAHIALPSAVYAEKDGTFTNAQGRVQRLHAAMLPMGDAKPEWEIMSAITARCGGAATFADGAVIFDELASREAAFKGLSWKVVGEQGAMLVGC